MALKKFNFNVNYTENHSRVGVIETHRGNIRTPAFMPVGTQATVKACTIDDIKKTGSEIILGNTYHLMIRPGVERIKRVGGLHKFMNCDLPILTDSGGFQAWSLPTKLLDDGIEFKNVYDGSFFKMTPEESINTQNLLGSDIAMIFDYLIDYDKSDDDQMKAIEITSQWAEKAKMYIKTINKICLA